MEPHTADTLVLVFTPGVSLRTWRETGMLSREWALYERLAEHYERIVVVTFGDADDGEYLRAAATAEVWARTVVVSNTDGLPASGYLESVPLRTAAAVGEARGVVVKTNQMLVGELAATIADAIRGRGIPVGLIARGGYLWTRFVAHEHGPHSPQALDAERAERALCTAADMTVGTTAEMVEDLAWRYGLDPTRAVVVPNYVLTDRPESDEAREEGLVLYAGQLVARKRVDLLIEAIAIVAEGGRKVQLEITGDGPELRRLKALAAERNAPVNFRPRIPHDQLLERMRRCSLYAQASELEGHPKTVIEAMASGAPVLVANATGLAGVVTHGSNGLRVEPDVHAIAHAMEELLADADWRDSLGAAAARTARAAYGLPGIVERELAVHRLAFEQGQLRPRLRATA